MKLVIQYVSEASVTVKGKSVGKINHGYAVLVGIGQTDNQQALEEMADMLLTFRIIPDKNHKLNLSIIDIKGDILLIPQFTLMGRLKGHRPSYSDAAPPKEASQLFDQFTQTVKDQSGLKVETGEFGAIMTCQIINQGPVTYILES